MKALNLYFASSFKNKEDLIWLRQRLHQHNVVDIWWNVDSKQELENDLTWYAKPATKAIEKRHFKQIEKSDAVILVGNIFNDSEPNFNGANVEVGYALALGIPVYSVGKIARSAMYASIIRCQTTPDLEKALSIYALAER